MYDAMNERPELEKSKTVYRMDNNLSKQATIKKAQIMERVIHNERQKAKYDVPVSCTGVGDLYLEGTPKSTHY